MSRFRCPKPPKTRSWSPDRRLVLRFSIKPNQRRGKKATSISTSYKLFGHRKDQRTKNNGEYVFKSSPNITNQDTNNISSIYCNLSYNMEKASRRIGNAFYETGVYEAVQTHSNIPSVGISNIATFHGEVKTQLLHSRKGSWYVFLPSPYVSGVKIQ